MKISKGLIVSCQALEGNPLRDTETIARLAQAAVMGGACALRINGADDIRACAQKVDVPIIGIEKKTDAAGQVIITPDYELACRVSAAGASVVALDATKRGSEIKQPARELIGRIRGALDCEIMADISDYDEAAEADSCGVDYISTTLSGYMPGKRFQPSETYRPDMALLKKLLKAGMGAKIIAEGRFWSPDDLERAFDLGVHAVVIGKAITNPIAITRHYISKINRFLQEA